MLFIQCFWFSLDGEKNNEMMLTEDNYEYVQNKFLLLVVQGGMKHQHGKLQARFILISLNLQKMTFGSPEQATTIR